MTRRNILEVAGALVLAYLWLGFCHDPSVVQQERDRVEVAVTDSTARVTDSLRVRVALTESTLVGVTRRMQRDSIRHRSEIARLRNRIVAPPDTLPTFVLEQLAARDTLIRTQDSVIAQQDSSLTLWKALAAERGTLIERLTGERDAFQRQRDVFRSRAERPSYAISDIAGGVLLGFGAATENEVVAGAGVATIALPRLARGIARLF